MTNQTISIGIDLGTTNSSVVINRNGSIEIVKKPGGLEYTPSVFGFDKAKNKVVGQRAYDSLYGDMSLAEINNYKPEVKRIIGTPEKFYFERAGVEMDAEEISAEILKSLKQDVLRKYPDFDTSAVVITIPAAFSVLQSEATKRAGILAGFKHVVLLQEPIAAAISYGFGNTNNANWLIYDLGGGTFDVALVSSTDGVLSVLAHNGDNFLGGKNLDWEIVDRVIVPGLLDSFSLSHFRRDNKAHHGKFARLKYLAEQAKIELSQYQTTTIQIDDIGADDAAVPIVLSIDLSREDLETIITPLVDRTIDLCKDALKESGIRPSSVSKIILVGGPTQIPYVKTKLQQDLDIAVDSSVDPLTVVARGACIYAMGQRIPDELFVTDPAKLAAGAVGVTLNYETLTADTVQTVTGTIQGLPKNADQYGIKIQSDSQSFSTPLIRLKNGTFLASVEIEPNKSNLLWLYLFDPSNNTVPINPDSFTITHGLSVAGAPLPHSIGVAVAQKRAANGLTHSEAFERLIEKGSILPAKRTETFKTVRTLRRAENDNLLWIRVGEGESNIPDRNAFVCELGIKGSDLPRDLPEGTPLQLTVEINEIRELTVVAYIPAIDLRLNARATFVDELVDLGDVETDLDTQIARARVVAEKSSDDQIARIEGAIRAVSSSLQNACLDEDEKRKAVKQIRDLKTTLDRAEKETELPQLRQDFADAAAVAESIISELPDAKDRQKFAQQLKDVRVEAEKASNTGDKTLLSSVNERLGDLRSNAARSNPATWLYHFRRLTNGSNRFLNQKEAADYVAKGKRAIEANDYDELRRCCRGLVNLLPLQEQASLVKNISGIMR